MVAPDAGPKPDAETYSASETWAGRVPGGDAGGVFRDATLPSFEIPRARLLDGKSRGETPQRPSRFRRTVNFRLTCITRALDFPRGAWDNGRVEVVIPALGAGFLDER